MSAGSGDRISRVDGGEVEAAVAEGELGFGGEAGGLGAVAGRFEAFCLVVREGVVATGLL